MTTIPALSLRIGVRVKTLRQYVGAQDMDDRSDAAPLFVCEPSLI